MKNSGEVRSRIAVLGGGITGLTAAYTLAQARRAGAPIEEMLVEGKERLGGVIRSERVDDFLLEAGPDSFLAEKPEAAALCWELGLGEALLGSNDHERRTYIVSGGRLAPLPDGLMLLVPTRIWPMVATPLLSLRSKVAIAAEFFTPPPSASRPQPNDESVASFVRRHFGQTMLENIVEPLLAGVFGGDAAALSIRSVLPRFWEMERQYGSLTRATLRLRKERLEARRRAGTSAPPPLPLFMTLEDGLQQLVDALAARLDPPRVHLGQQVTGLEALGAGTAPRYRIRCEGEHVFEANALILAMPTYACGRLLGALDSELGELLAGIPYTSSMTVSLVYDAGTTAQLPPGFGFLVPRKAKKRMLACTFVHGKFPHRAPPAKALLRCFLGGAHDPDVLRLADDDVLSIVRRELQEILGFAAEPRLVRIHRWPASMAQYQVGHAERLDSIQTRLDKHAGLFLAGNAYSGIGISDCVRTGEAAAVEALKSVGA